MSELSDDYLPLSALNDLLYCERRCALHHIEGMWIDNSHTLFGTLSHRRADKPVTWESADGVRAVHGMWLKCVRLRLVGKADVVEFHDFDKACSDLPSPSGDPAPQVPYPVEYKSGKRRKWDNDDVQLCAQAICLEEMLGITVPVGAIFHIKSKRRRNVVFSEALRLKTESAAVQLHQLISSRHTPPAMPKPQCRGCSLRDACLPNILPQERLIRDYCQGLLHIAEPAD